MRQPKWLIRSFSVPSLRIKPTRVSVRSLKRSRTRRAPVSAGDVERRLHSQTVSSRDRGGVKDDAEGKRLHLIDLESCEILLPNTLEILAYVWRIWLDWLTTKAMNSRKGYIVTWDGKSRNIWKLPMVTLSVKIQTEQETGQRSTVVLCRSHHCASDWDEGRVEYL